MELMWIFIFSGIILIVISEKLITKFRKNTRATFILIGIILIIIGMGQLVCQSIVTLRTFRTKNVL
jgi:uncharacterized membrane protein HdeD (DUF308 family)